MATFADMVAANRRRRVPYTPPPNPRRDEFAAARALRDAVTKARADEHNAKLAARKLAKDSPAEVVDAVAAFRAVAKGDC